MKTKKLFKTFLIAALLMSVISAQAETLVFISSSMPQESLVAWMNEANQADATVVMHGLVNNSMPDTKTFITNLIAKTDGQKGGISIDPELFRDFKIDQVPAVIVTPTINRCLNDPQNHGVDAIHVQCTEPPFDVVYGNQHLKAALTEIRDQGVNSQLATEALTAMGVTNEQ